jgi:hypothetical protein
MTDKATRNTAIKSAWKTFRDSKTSSAKVLKSSRKAAWTTFKTTAKNTCKESVPKEESESNDTNV